jgi:hypothetical protein
MSQEYELVIEDAEFEEDENGIRTLVGGDAVAFRKKDGGDGT